MAVTENEIFLNLGLYSPFPFKSTEVNLVSDFFLRAEDLQFDCYCINCKKEVPFKFSSRSSNKEFNYGNAVLSDSLKTLINSFSTPITLNFDCQRDNRHKASFSFIISGFKITKIGQFPSIASIETHSIDKYRKVLTGDYLDFSKAIGLFSHGIGAGSFVYLRRIFENLIEEKHLEAQNSDNWDDEVYKLASMDEKIKLLQNHLPKFLVENRKLYSILSKGIHDLAEDECLKIFPDVKLAIELILEEKIHMQEMQNKIKTARKFVSTTVERFKN